MNRKRPSHTLPAVLLVVTIGIAALGVWALLENRSRKMERLDVIRASHNLSDVIRHFKEDGSLGSTGALSLRVEGQELMVEGTLESPAQLLALKERVSSNNPGRPVFYEVAIVPPGGKAKAE